jgi:hypothetical protein
MNQGPDQPQDPARDAALDPYQRLGVDHDASFEAVQSAKLACLAEVGDDLMARSRVEAAYDAILMDRLKERQMGRVSSSARTASQREQQAAASAGRPAASSLPSLPQLPVPRLGRPSFVPPTLELASGRERWFPLVADGLLLVVLLLPSSPPDLLLALATGVTVLNLQRRNGRFLAAVGWSFVLLLVGLLIGSLLAGVIDPSLYRELSIAKEQVQSLPALILLLLGALLIG